jgi:hypothetical protein
VARGVNLSLPLRINDVARGDPWHGDMAGVGAKINGVDPLYTGSRFFPLSSTRHRRRYSSYTVVCVELYT